MGPTTQPIDFHPHMGAHQQKSGAVSAREAIAAGCPSHWKANHHQAQGRPRKTGSRATEKIKGHLTARELKEAWQSLKGWYKAATNHASKASKMSLATQTAELVALYGRVASKGDPIPTHANKPTFWMTSPVTANSGTVRRHFGRGAP
jgi:hypothetical protein